MDYERKYKDALSRAKELCDVADMFTITIHDIITIFPELKESEDERIRKGLIKSVSRIFEGHKLYDTDVTREEALAWLEKQGEQKHFSDFNANDWYVWDSEKKELKKIEVKTLNADKVIAWLVANICDFEYYVTRFKKDFGL